MFTAYALRAGLALTEIFTEDNTKQERSSFKYLIIALNRAYNRGERPVVLLSEMAALGSTPAEQADPWHTLKGTGAEIRVLPSSTDQPTDTPLPEPED